MKSRRVDTPIGEIRVRQRRPIETLRVSGNIRGIRFELNSTRHVDFDDANLHRVDFSKLRFDAFVSRGSTFVDCDFRGANLSAQYAPQLGAARSTVYRGCRFDEAELTSADLGQARFEDCSFANARVRKWFAFAAEFVNCRFEGTVRECAFFGVPWGADAKRLNPHRERNEFRGNDFRRADLQFVEFKENIDLTVQLLPDGPEYVRLDRFAERLAHARRVAAQWTDLGRRGEVLAFLKSMEAYLPDPSIGKVGQPEVFDKRHSGITPRAIETSAWKLLEDLP